MACSRKPDDKQYSVLAIPTPIGPDGRITAIGERSAKSQSATPTTQSDSSSHQSDGKVYEYAYDLGNRVKATATGRADQVCEYDWAGH